jgi:hypothetical protein
MHRPHIVVSKRKVLAHLHHDNRQHHFQCVQV